VDVASQNRLMVNSITSRFITIFVPSRVVFVVAVAALRDWTIAPNAVTS